MQVLGPLPRTVAAPVPVGLPPPAVWNGRIAAPDPALLEPSRSFPLSTLPRVAADGSLPRLVYRRPESAPAGRPRVALLLAGLGLSAADARAAIESLPGSVTLAFSAYTPNADALVETARARGHEFLASLPMESDGFPMNDAGPRSLLTGATPGANRENLEWALSRIQGYVGVTAASDGFRGERFAAQTSTFALMMDEIGRRGLLYVDPRPGAPPPRTAGRSVDLVIDDPATRADIEAKLAALERIARERGSAMGLAGRPQAMTVEKIAAWIRGLEARGIDIVPISALVGEASP
ncbi:MAG: divergent polysaccharide deacetylase family protein [Gemmatimonadaceae bacterium]|nr:divergent polysaccharide deacetylase family protein [Acetobacteraceae bacterium]